MEWNQEFETGLADIDVQHHYFFRLMQRTNQVRLGMSSEARAQMLEELLGYAKCHFTYEAALMLAYQYPGRCMHEAEHEQIAAKVLSFASEENANFHKVTLFLFDWFASHVTLEDLPMAKHVIECRARVLGVPPDSLKAS